MNCMKLINGGANDVSDFKTAVYYALLTKVDKDESTSLLVSDYTVASLCTLFSRVTDGEVLTALKELESLGVIKSRSNDVVVGDNGELFLATSSGLTFTEEAELITSHIQEYKQACKGSSAYKYTSITVRFATLLERSPSSYTVHDIGNLYDLTYEAVYQETPPRAIDGKEIGQVKHLIKMYGSLVVAKMVVYFVCNGERYTKGIPTLGLMLIKKDEVYDATIGKKAKRISTTAGAKKGF